MKKFANWKGQKTKSVAKWKSKTKAMVTDWKDEKMGVLLHEVESRGIRLKISEKSKSKVVGLLYDQDMQDLKDRFEEAKPFRIKGKREQDEKENESLRILNRCLESERAKASMQLEDIEERRRAIEKRLKEDEEKHWKWHNANKAGWARNDQKEEGLFISEDEVAELERGQAERAGDKEPKSSTSRELEAS